MSLTIVLTGATGLIGTPLTRYLLELGHKVVGTGLQKNSVDALADEIPSDLRSNFFPVALDLLGDGSFLELYGSIASNDLQPTHLINNARSIGTLKAEPDGTVSRENFTRELELQVVVPYELSIGFARRYGASLKGIINVGSQYGVVAPPPELLRLNGAPPHYGAAKAALIHLTKELAVRMAPSGVQVNCISFGGVEGRASREFMDVYGKLSPSGGMLTSEQLLEPFSFVLSKGSSGMTGHNLVVDGGWTIV
ncbi:SDR family oxidoreductase [Roseibium sp.]|uniref:SDR family oxidoreductase n=2 Tax=Roseibium sp. TaxID=1936156 RepID=UPI0032655024